MHPWSLNKDAVELEQRERQRHRILRIAVCADLNLLALACENDAGDTWTPSVDLFGLERVHDNALPYKYSFGPGCEVEVPFDFYEGGCGVALSTTTNVLFVAASQSGKIHVLDVERRTLATDIQCLGEPYDLACARDMMAVAVRSMERNTWSIEIRQCSGAYTVLRTVDLDPWALHPVVGLSTDGTELAVAASTGMEAPIGLALFRTDTMTVSNTFRQGMVNTILYWEDQGWVVSSRGCVQWLRDVHDPLPVLPTAMSCFKHPAIVPRFGMVWVRVGAWDDHERVHLVACPDVVAMRGMGEARVGWMVAVARTALLFP